MGELCKSGLFGEVTVGHHGQIQDHDTPDQYAEDKENIENGMKDLTHYPDL